MAQFAHNRRGRARGFTLIEVSLALIVFLMMTLMFAAVFPVAMRAGEVSNHYAQAALLAQHKLNQLRQAGYAKLDYTDLNNLGYVDTVPGQAAGYPSVLSFTQVDDLVPNANGNGYFPAGTTGTVTINNYDTSLTSTPPVNVTPNNMRLVTVTLTWPVPGQPAAAGQPNINGNAVGSYTTSTMIVSSH